jgi:hypothetical protein
MKDWLAVELEPWEARCAVVSVWILLAVGLLWTVARGRLKP